MQLATVFLIKGVISLINIILSFELENQLLSMEVLKPIK